MKKVYFIILFVVIFFIFIIHFLIFKAAASINDGIGICINNISKYAENELENFKQEEYIDNNEMDIGLYIEDGDKKTLVKDYFCDFTAEEVMGIFYAIPTQEEFVSGDNFKQVFERYYNNYLNSSKYKIGYNIKFTLNNGDYIDQTILNPDDAYLMFPKVQFYLYDDINLIPGRPYYHITQDIMTDDRICSSIKLVGDKNTKDIASPIELTVFTYDDESDFEPITKKYRGNSSYTIFIRQK